VWPWKKGTARGIAFHPLYPLDAVRGGSAREQALALMERAAEQLGEVLLEQLVFVGGAVADVLITDPAMPDIRPTPDPANART
jgi:hypothetical protein